MEAKRVIVPPCSQCMYEMNINHLLYGYSCGEIMSVCYRTERIHATQYTV